MEHGLKPKLGMSLDRYQWNLVMESQKKEKIVHQMFKDVAISRINVGKDESH